MINETLNSTISDYTTQTSVILPPLLVLYITTLFLSLVIGMLMIKTAEGKGRYFLIWFVSNLMIPLILIICLVYIPAFTAGLSKFISSILGIG